MKGGRLWRETRKHKKASPERSVAFGVRFSMPAQGRYGYVRLARVSQRPVDFLLLNLQQIHFSGQDRLKFGSELRFCFCGGSLHGKEVEGEGGGSAMTQGQSPQFDSQILRLSLKYHTD